MSGSSRVDDAREALAEHTRDPLVNNAPASFEDLTGIIRWRHPAQVSRLPLPDQTALDNLRA